MKLEKSEVKQSCKIKSQNVKHRVEIFQKKKSKRSQNRKLPPRAQSLSQKDRKILRARGSR